MVKYLKNLTLTNIECIECKCNLTYELGNNFYICSNCEKSF